MMDPNPNTGVLGKRRKFRDRHTERMSCEDKGRDRSDVSISQAAPGFLTTTKNQERGMGQILLTAS